jgi:hypothetical protein
MVGGGDGIENGEEEFEDVEADFGGEEAPGEVRHWGGLGWIRGLFACERGVTLGCWWVVDSWDCDLY